ncbi:MAG: hypothetical protein QOJ42_1961 [Acidobacteriaceae bacterium]|nr:hypothetical protein [Acidobacteriaceae bacterium]
MIAPVRWASAASKTPRIDILVQAFLADGIKHGTQPQLEDITMLIPTYIGSGLEPKGNALFPVSLLTSVSHFESKPKPSDLRESLEDRLACPRFRASAYER